MKNEIYTEDRFGDRVTFSIGLTHLHIDARADIAEEDVLVDLLQAKRLSKWLKKAIKELEKREARA